MNMFFRNLFSIGAAPVSNKFVIRKLLLNFPMGSYYSGKQIGAGIFDFGHKSILRLMKWDLFIKKRLLFCGCVTPR